MSEQVPSKELVATFRKGDVVRWNALALHGADRDGWTVEGMAEKLGLFPVYRVRKGRETGHAVQCDLEPMPSSTHEPPAVLNRYSIELEGDICGAVMQHNLCSDGEWVRYEDVTPYLSPVHLGKECICPCRGKWADERTRLMTAAACRCHCHVSEFRELVERAGPPPGAGEPHGWAVFDKSGSLKTHVETEAPGHLRKWATKEGDQILAVRVIPVASKNRRPDLTKEVKP